MKADGSHQEEMSLAPSRHAGFSGQTGIAGQAEVQLGRPIVTAPEVGDSATDWLNRSRGQRVDRVVCDGFAGRHHDPSGHSWLAGDRTDLGPLCGAPQRDRAAVHSVSGRAAYASFIRARDTRLITSTGLRPRDCNVYFSVTLPLEQEAPQGMPLHLVYEKFNGIEKLFQTCGFPARRLIANDLLCLLHTLLNPSHTWEQRPVTYDPTRLLKQHAIRYDSALPSERPRDLSRSTVSFVIKSLPTLISLKTLYDHLDHSFAWF